MVTLEQLKKKFWDGLYVIEYKDEKGKPKKKPEQFYFDKEGIQIAIKRALRDFTDRTERLNPEYKGQSFSVDRKFNLLCGSDGKEHNEPENESFVSEFIEYFKSKDKFMDKKNFDDWHNKMCEKFLSVFENFYDHLAYGKAQKIVNMTFKNAYCLSNKENSKFTNCDKYYEYCHMPLDSIILEWVKRTQASIKNSEYLDKGRIPSWSKMNYKEETDFLTSGGKKYYGYKDIQKAIFEYFSKYMEKNTTTKYLKGYTPLQAEFFVWKYMQLELAAEGIYKQLSSFDVYDEKTKEQIAQNVQTEPGANEEDKKPFNERSINEKLEYLQKMFKDIKKYKLQE